MLERRSKHILLDLNDQFSGKSHVTKAILDEKYRTILAQKTDYDILKVEHKFPKVVCK